MSATRLGVVICVPLTITALLCRAALADETTVRKSADSAVNLRLALKDTATGELVPGRITVEQRPAGAEPVYHFVESLDPAGTAVPYEVARSKESFEKHTTVSAHPFGAKVPPGMYVVSYEHGSEWRGNKVTLEVKKGEVTEFDLPITRWIDMNARGWYSGDTHVHRSLAELPNVMQAEDLNVALPLSYWVRDAYSPPALSDVESRGRQKGADAVGAAENGGSQPGESQTPFDSLITVEPHRVIWPMNTEYEIFTVNGQRHTLGAVFVLNHKQPLTLPAPPVAPIAAEARRQGAVLDLDKHSWPWSMMLVPIMEVDLFELANNHVWRTEFFFKQWTQDMRPEGWNIETDKDGFTEWGWIDFGFKTYYALLNCGFRLRPTAGTANGVHPVPLGFGRVYVECPEGISVPATSSIGERSLKPARQETQSGSGGFSFDKWMEGLNSGRSFVTTGPMLFVTVNDQPPGSTITMDAPAEGDPAHVRVRGSVENYGPLHRIEIVKNGRVVDVIDSGAEYDSPNVCRASFDAEVPVETTSWIAVRCFAGRTDDPTAFRFAHSSPVHIEMPGKPLRPQKIETDYFITRMEQEITRNKDVLAADELAEYKRALAIYRDIAR